MANTGAAATAAGARNFAALLADFAAPREKFPPARDLNQHDGLADDVATLSYESALRTHARYHPAAAPLPMALPAAPDATVPADCAKEKPEPASPPAAPVTPISTGPVSAVSVNAGPETAAQEPSRCTRVTLRLSPAEDEQLRRRATEAGMTVSAYLRSCTFEVESLRAEVKAMLAELRHARQGVPDRAARKSPWWPHWRRNKGSGSSQPPAR